MVDGIGGGGTDGRGNRAVRYFMGLKAVTT
jgi:hypothetical protein